MKKIPLLIKNNKLFFIASLIIATILILGFAGILISTNSNEVRTTSNGITYDVDGSKVEFEKDAKIESNWDETKSINALDTKAILNNDSVLVYEDQKFIPLDESAVIDLNNNEVYDLPKNKEISKVSNGYEFSPSVANEDEMATIPEMVVKTKETSYLILSPSISATYGGETKEYNDFVQVKFDQYGEINFLSSDESFFLTANDLKITTAGGLEYLPSSNLLTSSNGNSINVSEIPVNKEGEIDETAFTRALESGIINDENNNSSSKNNNSSNQSGNSNGSQGSASTSGGVILPSGIENTANEISNFFQEWVRSINQPPPKATVEVKSIEWNKISYTVNSNDPNNLFQGPLNFILTNPATGQTIKSQTFDPKQAPGIVTFDDLMPNTTYLLKVDGVYKSSQMETTSDTQAEIKSTTPDININLSTVDISQTETTINVKIPSDAPYKSADLEIVENNNSEEGLLSTFSLRTSSEIETINVAEAKTGNGQNIKFTGLTSNSSYTVKPVNIIKDNDILTENTSKLIFMTMKKSAYVGSVAVSSINSPGSSFTVGLSNVTDPDASINGVRYEIYESANRTVPVLTTNRSSNELKNQVTFYVDNITLKRGVTYVVRAVTIGNDNVSNTEITTNYSTPILLNGKLPPTATIREVANETTNEKIVLEVKVSDPGSSLVSNPYVSLTTGNTTKYEITELDSWVRVEIDQLQANRKYVAVVTGIFDLNDGNGVVNYPIKNIAVKTAATSLFSWWE